MKKQTKLVAVLSTAALLAIGASMTSFTAQMLAMVSLPFFMQNILGYSAVHVVTKFRPVRIRKGGAFLYRGADLET